ncbi:Protocadherin Alpha-2 [Manis pentadactyla]|nr:Protocadherin Alpha-2 [Manis pentadactyla]
MGEKRVQRHVLSFSARATSRFPQEWTRLRVELLEKLRAGQAALKLEGEDGKVVKPQELLLELGATSQETVANFKVPLSEYIPLGKEQEEALAFQAEVIITTAGEFVRLGDKDLNDSLETRQSPQTVTRIEITSAFELATLLANLDQSEHFSIEDGIKLENDFLKMLKQMLVPLAIALIHFTEAVVNPAECTPSHTPILFLLWWDCTSQLHPDPPLRIRNLRGLESKAINTGSY